ncbi:MAG: GFA family protein [Moraxellaceae bacterium]|nr:MAG: GFA family protein [Moraxellaceae bacterium]
MNYSGSCHCGAVKYEVDMTIDNVMSCNCSICNRKGHLLAFTPAATFKLLQGDDALNDYQFGKKSIHHLFCKTCGVSSFARGSMPDGAAMCAINVRCLENVDIKTFPIIENDGIHQ